MYVRPRNVRMRMRLQFLGRVWCGHREEEERRKDFSLVFRLISFLRSRVELSLGSVAGGVKALVCPAFFVFGGVALLGP